MSKRQFVSLLLVALLGLSLYASSNRPPEARFSYDALSEEPKLTVNTVVAFDGSGSSDSDGRIVQYEWDFEGDGTYDRASDSPTIEWLYDDPGNYQASLRVTDNGGATATEAGEIVVEDEPVAVRQRISTPMAPNRALPGDWIEVMVEITLHQTVNGLGLAAKPPRGWRFKAGDNGGAFVDRHGKPHFNEEEGQYEWLWGQGLLGDRLRIAYELKVPEDAARGSYKIGGLVTSYGHPWFKIPIPKEVEVEVM